MYDLSDETIIDGVLAEFSKLAGIPRKSGHEKAVSDYLVARFRDIGCKVHQDHMYNVVADLPATSGKEAMPLTILQGHMDMVCVAAPGVNYDPLTDSIKLVRSDKFLSAEGTSLGADDGIGIAEIIYIMSELKEHGPLRAVVTVDEEEGMTGAINLDKKFLSDARYLINCDSENYDELTVGSAGSVNIDFNRELTYVAPQGNVAYKIAVSGLKGGHSGMEINTGRGNAIRTMAILMNALDEAGIVYELAGFTGGKARNSIPAQAEIIITAAVEKEVIQEVLTAEKDSFLAKYGDNDGDISLSLEAVNMPDRVMTEEDRNSIIQLIVSLHSGVFAMSQVVPGLVETSANLGMVLLADSGNIINIKYFPRSSIDSKLGEFVLQADIMAQMAGFTAVIGTQSPGWKERKDSALARLMQEVFCEQNKKPMKVETIHAGLECGWHLNKNPQLDIVSIGVTTHDIHSPEERLELWSIVPQVKLIAETLKRIEQV
ncbi:MAG: beta-Ala-His dipeptidase [Anaerovibrio sp.]|nr:beta-Ala-His dipeptidase [Anaerovibrio sp.]MCR5175492.1 beta-Ala-His dipeptidase [Anaerovibrio sp.]